MAPQVLQQAQLEPTEQSVPRVSLALEHVQQGHARRGHVVQREHAAGLGQPVWQPTVRVGQQREPAVSPRALLVLSRLALRRLVLPRQNLAIVGGLFRLHRPESSWSASFFRLRQNPAEGQ
jgi:hypothetical protein